MKRCNTCGETKPRGDFYSKGGRCKPCAADQQRAYKAANREKVLQMQRRYRSNPEIRDRLTRQRREEYRQNSETERQRLRNWRRANRERYEQWHRAYYEANRERYERNGRAWRAANPDKVRLLARRRAALRRASSSVPFTVTNLMQRLSVFGDKCWICREADWEHIDHVKPLSKGGPHILANLRPACAECNHRKSAKWPFDPALIRRAA